MKKVLKHLTALAMVLVIIMPVLAAVPAHAIDVFGNSTGGPSNLGDNLGLGNRDPRAIARRASCRSILEDW